MDGAKDAIPEDTLWRPATNQEEEGRTAGPGAQPALRSPFAPVAAAPAAPDPSARAAEGINQNDESATSRRSPRVAEDVGGRRSYYAQPDPSQGEGLRRAASAPWTAINAHVGPWVRRMRSRAGGDRSAHARMHGTNGGAVDASAHTVTSQTSRATNTSRRSLFTVDGEPEPHLQLLLASGSAHPPWRAMTTAELSHHTLSPQGTAAPSHHSAAPTGPYAWHHSVSMPESGAAATAAAVAVAAVAVGAGDPPSSHAATHGAEEHTAPAWPGGPPVPTAATAELHVRQQVPYGAAAAAAEGMHQPPPGSLYYDAWLAAQRVRLWPHGVRGDVMPVPAEPVIVGGSAGACRAQDPGAAAAAAGDPAGAALEAVPEVRPGSAHTAHGFMRYRLQPPAGSGGGGYSHHSLQDLAGYSRHDSGPAPSVGVSLPLEQMPAGAALAVAAAAAMKSQGQGGPSGHGGGAVLLPGSVLHAVTLRNQVREYFIKWKGVRDTALPRDSPMEIFWSWLGAFLSILLVAALNHFFSPHINLPLVVASFGAAAVLLFGVPASKLGQPRNLIGGQVISAFVGVVVRLIFGSRPDLVWLSSALGMSLALVAMQLTQTVHPPGGATALIAASAPVIGPWHGFKFLLTVFFGSLGLMVVALVVNNISPKRRYPTFWTGL